jgi:hypothetical protein
VHVSQNVAINKPKKTKLNETISQSGEIVTNKLDIYKKYREIIRNNIEYEIIKRQHDKERVDEIIEIMLECICSASDTIRVAKEDMPAEVVKARLLKINEFHIEYILRCISENTTKIGNIKQYLKTAIFNAPITIENYYTARVNSDLYGE